MQCRLSPACYDRMAPRLELAGHLHPGRVLHEARWLQPLDAAPAGRGRLACVGHVVARAAFEGGQVAGVALSLAAARFAHPLALLALTAPLWVGRGLPPRAALSSATAAAPGVRGRHLGWDTAEEYGLLGLPEFVAARAAAAAAAAGHGGRQLALTGLALGLRLAMQPLRLAWVAVAWGLLAVGALPGALVGLLLCPFVLAQLPRGPAADAAPGSPLARFGAATVAHQEPEAPFDGPSSGVAHGYAEPPPAAA